jgi:hypothetical protein
MIVKVDYRGIKWDNYQGASGMPYEDSYHVVVDPELTLAELVEKVHEKKHEMEQETYTGEVEITNISIVKKASKEVWTSD